MKFARRLSNRLLHLMARQLPGATGLRLRLHRWRGVKVGANVFIGDEVYLENEYPERVEIQDGAQISIRAIVLAHTRGPGWVVIEKDAYVGPNAVVVTSAGKTLRIGEGAVVGAGVVVTKDVPARAFVAPQPADPVATVTVPLAKAECIEDFIRGLIPLRTSARSAARPMPARRDELAHDCHK
jgi:heptaprenylglycerol acetyltransferase